jgi:predicted CXXCH cytochrome family protein
MRRAAQRVFLFGALGLWAASALAAGIATTKHNLSATGGGNIKASSESQICIFCHTPHSGSPAAPLWNRRATGSSYTPYTSSTVIGLPGQPNGASLLCLSCHDGTIALGDVLSRSTAITMAGGVTTMPAGPTRLSTDLSDDHPVSFVYSATLAAQRGELVNPSTLTGAVKLDAAGRLQCTACHNPHDNTYGKFLVKSDRAGALCQTCHVKNFWNQTSHNLSTATWNGATPDPWPSTTWTTVADNACQNCHTPHTAGGRQRLLNYAAEETNCLVCHNGNVAPKSVQADFNKVTHHPVENTTGVHDPKEPAVVTARHVECVDCHNPHAAKPGSGTPAGPLTGVRGVDINNAAVNPVTYEYQICFRCHGDSTNQPPPRTTRVYTQINKRLQFSPTNPSYHPVAAPGKNPNVPSLIPPLTTSSTINCSDCHNSNSSPKGGGSGPSGPHGSTYSPLLVRQYITQDPTIESASTYALCYGCHDRNSILGNQSFPRHSLHVGSGGGMGGGGGGMGGVNAPCNNCHDAHGVSSTQGNSVNNAKLINFNTAIVKPNSAGLLRFESLGTFSGRCYLSCHGKNHNPCTYGTAGGGGGGGMGGGGGGMGGCM